MLTNAIIADTAADFAADIRAGLTKTGQKELPSKYLYDTLGSKLFEVIVRTARIRIDTGGRAAAASKRT